MNLIIKKTISEWSKEYDVTVLDPDGFDRTDILLSSRLFTRNEFKEGLLYSTIILNGNSLEKLQKIEED